MNFLKLTFIPQVFLISVLFFFSMEASAQFDENMQFSEKSGRESKEDINKHNKLKADILNNRLKKNGVRVTETKLPEFGDIKIMQIRIPEDLKLNLKMVIEVTRGLETQPERNELYLADTSDDVWFSVMSVDTTQAGNNNSISSLRFAVKSGEQIKLKQLRFPPGYASNPELIVDPYRFSLSWKMDLIFGQIGYEVKNLGPILIRIWIEER